MASPAAPPFISVIIPACNEAEQLPSTLASLSGQTPLHETILVDARSSDGTAKIAQQFGAKVLPADIRQRASQMNAGAQAAAGQILLFLHADTRLAPGALETMARILFNGAIIGGGFARRYDSTSPVLRVTCALAELRTRCFGWFLGDQAMFVRRNVFDALGGFSPWDIFEDLDFSRRMAGMGRVVTLRPGVVSAGRRFDARGPMATTWSDLGLTARYLLSRRPSPTGDPPRQPTPILLSLTL